MSMRLLRLFGGREATAPVARERLQILLAHERGLLGQSDLLVTLREEILAVVSKHIQLDPDKVMVKLERGKTVSTLEVDIEVPNNFDNRRLPARGAWPADRSPRAQFQCGLVPQVFGAGAEGRCDFGFVFR